jgi:hypothetical protein
MGYYSWVLKDPLVAAASTGKTHIVECILTMMEDYSRRGLRALRLGGYAKTRVCAAITAAIKLKDAKMVMILCKFARIYGWRVDRNESRHGGLPSPIVSWLKDAASSGCITTYRAVLYVQSVLSEHKSVRRAVDQLFDAAYEKGHATLIRSMLNKGLGTCKAGQFHQVPMVEDRNLNFDSREFYETRRSSLQLAARGGSKDLIDIFDKLGRRHQPERAHCGCGGAWTSLHGIPDAEPRRTDYSEDHQPSKQMPRHDEVQRPSLARLQTPTTNLLSCSETCCGKVSNDHERQA